MALVLRSEKGSKLTIEELDGNFTYLESIGASGSQGPQGPQGPAGSGTASSGATGATGATGPQGEAGPTGSQGAQGPAGSGTASQGEAGATGPQGEAGPTGSQGDIGATGPQGDIGATGSISNDAILDGNSFFIRTYNGGTAVSFDGTSSVLWWNANDSNEPIEGGLFRGAIINYHGYSNTETTIGTIIISSAGTNSISHTETNSGPNTYWTRTGGADQLYFSMTSSIPGTVSVHFTSTMFYGI